VQLAADGKEQWRAPTGGGPSVAGTVILSDDTRLVATSAGEAVGFSPSGAVRFHVALDLPERNARIGLLPLEDGGVAIGAGREVVEIDGDGHLRARTRLDERIGGPLVATEAGIIATAQNGAVYALRAGFAKRVGTLGGDPGEAGASTPDGRTLLAVVDSQRVIALDLATGAAQVRLSVTDQSLHGPIVYGRGDALVLVTWSGVVTTIGPSGNVQRTPLESRPETLMTDGGKVDFAALDESPPPVTDPEGRVAFARVGGRIGVISPDGTVNLLAGPACNSPAALAPAGPHRMVVACRDGAILLLGEETP
jgi:outer membrane protein assembly factor BamB